MLVQADFLCLDMGASELSEVRGVILDPSCSGSGTTHSRMDHLLPSKGHVDAEQEATRLQSLAAFQVLPMHILCCHITNVGLELGKMRHGVQLAYPPLSMLVVQKTVLVLLLMMSVLKGVSTVTWLPSAFGLLILILSDLSMLGF